MIIYPPFIADTIPGFISTEINIPFSQNPAVSWDEVKGFRLMIKNYQNSEVIAYLDVNKTSDNVSYKENTKTGNIKFDLSLDAYADFKLALTSFTVGQYYKFQLSYTDDTKLIDGITPYTAYSTASIGRYVGEVLPTISISTLGHQLEDNKLNVDGTLYTGTYISTLVSEPIYSYHFTLTNAGTVIQDSGEILHNADSDIIESNTRKSYHDFKIKYELTPGVRYKLQYTITTVNGLVASSPVYTIIKAGHLPTGFVGELIAEQTNEAIDNGYVNIRLTSNHKYRGTFVLERTSDHYEWSELARFTITHISNMEMFNWKDWSVEQGVQYTYAIRQVYRNQYSERILSKPITVNFEDMFLSDGVRQLKIQYNPKVSSFKNTILEQKTDTIGSKYPFFFRNNMVKYKEIPISGLISYHMDDCNLFMDSQQLGFSNLNLKSTDLTNHNYAAERQFKLEVLEWLTNGELKLFRSPAEGNYVVRLMNTSLSPNDTVGRMLHSFTSTGYEAADNDIDSLKEHKLINFVELKDPPLNKAYKTLDLDWWNDDNTAKDNGYAVFTGNEIEHIQWYTNKPTAKDDDNDHNNHIILIDTQENEYKIYNVQGVYSTPDKMIFTSIKIPMDVLINGTIHCAYQLELTEEILGVDSYEKLITETEDILFSIPIKYTIIKKGDEDPDDRGLLSTKSYIYKTYVLRVQRDPNATYEDNKEYQFIINDNIIDCSDGQARYYYDLDQSYQYEKGLGLHVDIYARIHMEAAMSSALGQFRLGISRLG